MDEVIRKMGGVIREWVDRGWEFVDHHFVTLSLMAMFVFVYLSLINFAHSLDSKAYEFASDACKGILGALLMALQAGGNGSSKKGTAVPTPTSLVHTPVPTPTPASPTSVVSEPKGD